MRIGRDMRPLGPRAGRHARLEATGRTGETGVAMNMFRIGVVLVLTAGVAAAGDEITDLSGIWIGKSAGLVIDRHAEGSFVGRPTDLSGAADITWHFYRLGPSEFRFWVMAQGNGGVEKYAECELSIRGERMTLPIKNARGDPGEMVFERTFTRIPSEVAGVKITFRASKKDDVNPDQYVERGLVTAFTSAVASAKEACPDLRRVLISATVGTRVYGGKHHRRDRRTGLCIGAVNGVSLANCGIGVGEAVRRLKEGVRVVPEEEAYVLAAVTLLACLSVREEVEDLMAPDLLDASGSSFTAWFLENRWKRLPGSRSLETWREEWKALEKFRWEGQENPLGR